MIFLRDRRLKAERSANSLIFSYQWDQGLKWLSLVAAIPIPCLIGLCTSLPAAKFGQNNAADWVLIATCALMAIAGLHLVAYAWLTEYRVLATREDLTVTASPVPGFRRKSLKAATILQLIAVRGSESGWSGELRAILTDYSVVRLVSNLPSEFAALEMVRDLNAFYELPLRAVEGWKSPFTNPYDVATEDDLKKPVPASKASLEVTSDARSLEISGQFHSVWTPVVALFGGFLSLMGAMGAAIPETAQRSDTPIYVMLGIGLALMLSLLPLCGNRFRLGASGSNLRISYSPFPLVSPVNFEMKGLRRFFLYGKHRQSLWMVDANGFVTRIFSGFQSNEAAAMARDRLNQFYDLASEELATFASLTQDQEALSFPQKGVSVEASGDGTQILITSNIGIAWGRVIFMFGFVVCLSVGMALSKLGAEYWVLFGIYALVMLAPIYMEFVFELTQMSVLLKPDSLLITTRPHVPLFGAQKVDMSEAICFQAKSTKQGSLWTIKLRKAWTTIFLRRIRCDSNQAYYVASQLNAFYGLDRDCSTDEAKFKRSGPVEEYKSKFFTLARDSDGLRAFYKTSGSTAIGIMILGAFCALILIPSFQYFWFAPAVSVVGILSGLAGVIVIGQGLVWLLSSKTLVASRSEVVLSFGPLNWKKPIRVDPDTVKEWIAQGLPKSDVETGRAILGYKDAHYDFKPFARDLPSWAIADYLKHQLEVFYANQSKGDPTDQS